MQRFRALNRRRKVLGCGGVAAGFLTMSCLLIALLGLATADEESNVAQGAPTTTVSIVAEVVSTQTSRIMPSATATLEPISTTVPQATKTAPATLEPTSTAATVSEATATAPTIPESTTPLAGIEFIEVRGGAPNDTASVSVRTQPNEKCDIGYSTPSGTSSEADGLHAKVADGMGMVTWEWEIGPSTNPGSGNITVTCGGDSAFADIEITA